MNPRVGDHVHFFHKGSGPFAATVCKVHAHESETELAVGPAHRTVDQPHAHLVNLCVLSEVGIPYNKVKVPWFEFRKDVAVKTDSFAIPREVEAEE